MTFKPSINSLVEDTTPTLGGNLILSSNQIRETTGVGTANTGITAVTTGTGKSWVTVCTVAVTDAFTVVDNGAASRGYLIYTFPSGAIGFTVYLKVNLQATSTEIQLDTPEYGIGVTQANSASATLSGNENSIYSGNTFADCNGTDDEEAAVDKLLRTSNPRTIYFNVADTWADDTSTDLTIDLTGTITFVWQLLT